MRKYLRAMARARMKALGIKHINRKGRDHRGHKLPSKFAVDWRKYAADAG